MSVAQAQVRFNGCAAGLCRWDRTRVVVAVMFREAGDAAANEACQDVCADRAPNLARGQILVFGNLGFGNFDLQSYVTVYAFLYVLTRIFLYAFTYLFI